MLKKNM